MFFYTLFYLLFTFLLIFPPVEFVTAGLTIPGIFAKLLGSEGETFIEFHMIRIIVTIFVHSYLPLGYILGLYLNDPDLLTPIFNNEPGWFLWRCFLTTALVIPVFSGLKIFDWWRDSWSRHPVAVNLGKFCNENQTDWITVASTVNTEFRRFDKVIIQTNSTSRGYVTDSWIIKITMYNVYFVHQSDALLIVNSSDTHELTPTGNGETQFINIEVKSARAKMPAFNFRLIAQDFKDLQDKIRRPIIIMPHIVFHKSLIDKFIDVFKETVELNEKYLSTHDLELCIGCMQERSNVKLTKKCSESVETNGQQPTPQPPQCAQCNCRPLWCVACLARWFASRQDPEQTDKWLSSKSTCPVCRSTFCLLDVAMVREGES